MQAGAPEDRSGRDPAARDAQSGVFGAALVNWSWTSWKAIAAPSTQVNVDSAIEAARCLVLVGRFRYHQAAPMPAVTRSHGLVAAAIPARRWPPR